MLHYQTNNSILRMLMLVYVYFCEHILFIRITLDVGKESM